MEKANEEPFTPAQQKFRVTVIAVAGIAWGTLRDFTSKPWHPWLFGALALIYLWAIATPPRFRKLLPAWIVMVIIAMGVYGIILFR